MSVTHPRSAVSALSSRGRGACRRAQSTEGESRKEEEAKEREPEEEEDVSPDSERDCAAFSCSDRNRTSQPLFPSNFAFKESAGNTTRKLYNATYL